MPEYNSVGVGKLPPKILESSVLRFRGACRPEVVVGPGLGEDAALIRWGGARYLVVASDPVVGASHGAGRLLVHVNANDVACKGADPAWFMADLIVPASYGAEYIKNIMEEIHGACLELGAAVVGGHTELTDRYDHPVLVGTMMGHSDYAPGAEKIRAGDVLIATKHAGLEGMSIIANDRPDLLAFLSAAELDEVRAWQNDFSILKEARLLRDLASYMHDPTEGGVGGGLLEICESCGLGLEMSGAVPLSPLTARAAEKIGFDPMHLISSGVLLAALPERDAGTALARLADAGVKAGEIARFAESGGGSPALLSAGEELWRILSYLS